MKTIKLHKMVLSNFKGVQNATYEFYDITDIRGGNATGKSTIYEAYLWCLFDKNQHGNTPEVQPLDENNEVKHRLVTSVKMWLTIDGNQFIVERTLQEKWTKPRGMTETVLNGTTSEYAVNEVPLTKTQFTQKLAEILPLDKWFMLSNIAIIPALDQKTCRAALQDIAPKIDEKMIAAQYPAVQEASANGISIEELTASVRKGKQKAKEELDSIPAAMEAQDRLRIDDDFDTIEQHIEALNISIDNYQIDIERLQNPKIDEAEIQRMAKVRQEYDDILRKISDIERNTISNERIERQELKNNIERAEQEVKQIHARINSDKKTAEIIEQDIERHKKQIADLRTKWQSVNSEQYQEPTMNNICPACGQQLPAERIESARQQAREQFNTAKANNLRNIQAEAEQVKVRIDELTKELMTKQQNSYTERLSELQMYIEEQQAAETKIQDSKEILQSDSHYQWLLRTKSDIESKMLADGKTDEHEQVAAKISELKEEKAALSAERDKLNKRLAGKEQNIRIDKERVRLEKREQELAQMIADYEFKENQITAFRKAKITAVEESVSSLFTMVRWKMYEQNITNDGEKEICQAIIAGVPYEQQNRATQVNAGIDIVNAFAKAYQISLPLFIDNAESVEQTIPTNGQKIRLTVVAGEDLSINNITF